MKEPSISLTSERTQKRSLCSQGMHSVRDPLFFVVGGQMKQGPMLVVFRDVPGMHGAEV